MSSIAVERLTELRRQVKQIAELLSDARSDPYVSEAKANLVIAYRHMEDASMRLGKAIQASDGGVSVYDQSTAVMR